MYTVYSLCLGTTDSLSDIVLGKSTVLYMTILSFSLAVSLVFLLLRQPPMAAAVKANQEDILRCLVENSGDPSISDLVHFMTDPSFPSAVSSYVRNLRFSTSSTPKPLFVVAPARASHVRASVLCTISLGLELRIRSGGHDYDGLSYISRVPFFIVDMCNMRSIDVDVEARTAWVQSGATLGELYYRIFEKSGRLGFPAGVCPTVGVGGHLSGGGYGNMMRKFGLSVDNVVDAEIIDSNGRLLNRESMGEDLFWAIRGGGGASFGVIISWKIKLVQVPEIVTVFKIERTLEQSATDIVHKWQYIAPTIDKNLFIRVVLMPSVRKDARAVKAKFVALFLGDREGLIDLMSRSFPELGLEVKDCVEMSWIESVLFWDNRPFRTSPEVLLKRIPNSERFLKRKSDYIQKPISRQDLEGLWRKMIELRKPVLTFNPYGGRMSEIVEDATPFPHRTGNLFKIQYSVNWKDEGKEASDEHMRLIRELYDYMTPYVTNSPRSSYLNYRDVDIGINPSDTNASYSEAGEWGRKYFKDNFDRLVRIKTRVDPGNVFRCEQSIPCLEESWQGRMVE